MEAKNLLNASVNVKTAKSVLRTRGKKKMGLLYKKLIFEFVKFASSVGNLGLLKTLLRRSTVDTVHTDTSLHIVVPNGIAIGKSVSRDY